MQAISNIGDSFGAGVLPDGDVDSQASIRGRLRAEFASDAKIIVRYCILDVGSR